MIQKISMDNSKGSGVADHNGPDRPMGNANSIQAWICRNSVPNDFNEGSPGSQNFNSQSSAPAAAGFLDQALSQLLGVLRVQNTPGSSTEHYKGDHDISVAARVFVTISRTRKARGTPQGRQRAPRHQSHHLTWTFQPPSTAADRS